MILMVTLWFFNIDDIAMKMDKHCPFSSMIHDDLTIYIYILIEHDDFPVRYAKKNMIHGFMFGTLNHDESMAYLFADLCEKNPHGFP